MLHHPKNEAARALLANPLPFPEIRSQELISRLAPRLCSFDPNKVAWHYSLIVEGDFLAPAIAAGERVLVDPRLPVDAGDLVVIFLRPEIVAGGEHQATLHWLRTSIPAHVRFPWTCSPISEVAELFFAESLSPWRLVTWRCADVLAVHRCLGPVPIGTPSRPVTAAELAEISL